MGDENLASREASRCIPGGVHATKELDCVLTPAAGHQSGGNSITTIRDGQQPPPSSRVVSEEIDRADNRGER